MLNRSVLDSFSGPRGVAHVTNIVRPLVPGPARSSRFVRRLPRVRYNVREGARDPKDSPGPAETTNLATTSHTHVLALALVASSRAHKFCNILRSAHLACHVRPFSFKLADRPGRLDRTEIFVSEEIKTTSPRACRVIYAMLSSFVPWWRPRAPAAHASRRCRP